MQITPTTKGSLIAGIGLGIITVLALLHIDRLTALFGWKTYFRDKMIVHINRQKAVSLMFTEGVNLVTHGTTDPDAVWFWGGNTIVNILTIWGLVPLLAKGAAKRLAAR
jgi:hypothetical protein